MATQVFMRDDPDASATGFATHRGTNTAKLNTTTTGWYPLWTSTSRGAGLVAGNTPTVAGPTNGIEIAFNPLGGTNPTLQPLEWITPPIDQDVTISGTITGNVWAAEALMTANVASNFYIDKVSATDLSLTRIVTSTRTTEMAVTSRGVDNFTATPTSTALAKGDRLRIVWFGDDAGTMAAGSTFNMAFNGPTGGADGDTFITFNETFGFQTTDPETTTSHEADIQVSSIGASSTTSAKLGQSFQLASSGAVLTVAIKAGANNGSPTDDVRLSIQTDSSGPSGVELGSATIASASWTASAWNTTPLSAALSASTTYWLVVERTGAISGVNVRRWVRDSAAGYANGQHATYSNVSGLWSLVSADDMNFRITTVPTVIYPTNTNSAVVTADVDKEAWTSRGGSAVSATADPAAGWISPFQAQSGGTNITWFTRGLSAFTLSGLVKCNIRAQGVGDDVSVGCQIARVDNDGTNASVWGYANILPIAFGGSEGRLDSAEAAYTAYVAGDDLAVSGGQRLRIRFFVDDCADAPHTGSSASIYFGGPTGGASGDTFLTFGQTLTEGTAAAATSLAHPRKDPSFRMRSFDPWSQTGWQ